MKLEPYSEGTISYLKYPKHRIKFNSVENSINLEIPSFLIIELIRLQILPVNTNKSVQISVSGKNIGKYRISEFVYPNSIATEEVLIRFEKIK